MTDNIDSFDELWKKFKEERGGKSGDCWILGCDEKATERIRNKITGSIVFMCKECATDMVEYISKAWEKVD
jgi:hypothetical protein